MRNPDAIASGGTATAAAPELQRLRDDMAREITRTGTQAGADAGDAPTFRRVAVPLAGVDVLAWLNLQQSPVKLYWGARDGAFEAAGIGTAHRLCAPRLAEAEPVFEAMARGMAQSDAGLRYYGGLRFYEPRDDDAAWEAFPGLVFVAPRFELTREGDDTRLVCNLPEAADSAEIDAILAQLDELVFDLALPENAIPAPRRRRDTPDRAGWMDAIDAALDALGSDALDKVVLARRADLAFGERLNAVALLRRLKAVTPDCFHFCFQPRDGAAFVGASPERLYRRAGRALETEAVAGTRPRGGSVARDSDLGNALLGSDKDLREHYYVREAIHAALAPVCRELAMADDVALLKLARGQHLFTRLAARLQDGIDDAELLRRLHPTPAVGGCPTEAAIAHMREWERFDRGWYAAPFGWIGREGAEFAVAIRSALVRGAQLSLFSGAGIVTGSTPESEWEEIENKIEDFIRILTGTRHP